MPNKPEGEWFEKERAYIQLTDTLSFLNLTALAMHKENIKTLIAVATRRAVEGERERIKAMIEEKWAENSTPDLDGMDYVKGIRNICAYFVSRIKELTPQRKEEKV